MSRNLDIYGPFFSLLASSLDGNVPPSLPADAAGWWFVYETARRHAVHGVLFDVIEKLPAGSGIPEELAADWLMDVRKIEADNSCIEAVVGKQKEAWARHGIDAVLLKGLETAAYYPCPAHRAIGDIDWWMKSSNDWDKALDVVGNNGLKWRTDSDGDISYELGGVMVEHHRKGLEAEGPEGVLLMLNEHILHHAMVFGAGMRQLYDYAAALKYYEGRYDRAVYASLLEERHITRWTAVLHSALAEAGLYGTDGIRCADCRRLLGLVMEDGNLGMDKSRRSSGLLRRATLLLRIAPARLLSRWAALARGRIKNNSN